MSISKKLSKTSRQRRTKKRKPLLITTDWLISKGACHTGISWFNERYPEGALLTAAVVQDAVLHRHDVEWFIWVICGCRPAYWPIRYKRFEKASDKAYALMDDYDENTAAWKTAARRYARIVWKCLKETKCLPK